MLRDSAQHAALVIVGEEDLEGVAGEHDKVELLPEADGADVCLDPADMPSAWS